MITGPYKVSDLGNIMGVHHWERRGFSTGEGTDLGPLLEKGTQPVMMMCLVANGMDTSHVAAIVALMNEAKLEFK